MNALFPIIGHAVEPFGSEAVDLGSLKVDSAPASSNTSPVLDMDVLKRPDALSAEGRNVSSKSDAAASASKGPWCQLEYRYCSDGDDAAAG